MPLILGTNSIKDTGFNVSNSLMFNSASADRMTSPTRGTATSQKKGTFSWWQKKCKTGQQRMMGTFENGNNEFEIKLRSDDTMQFYQIAGGSNNLSYITTRVFRDPSAWMHIVFAIDTTQSSASDRVKIYINGVQETSFSTSTNSMPQNHSFHGFYQGLTMSIGVNGQGDNATPYDGYFAEWVYVDGLQLDPTSFGEFNSDSPTIWQPIDVSGLTFGNNGFYLQFKESGTSQNSSGLGADTSGNDNHFAVTNLTAESQSTDSCTNNFCTMNPLDNYYASNTYSEGNIKFVTKASGGFAYGTSTIGLSSGKWYAEFDCIATTDSGAYHQVGIVEKPSASTTTSATANIGSSAYSWAYYAADGKSRNSASYSTYGDSWTTGNIIGVYLNLDDNELRFSKDGVIQNSGTAISITAPASNGTGHYFITAGGMSTNASVTFEANFGNPFQSQSSSVSDANGYGAFEYSPTLSGVNYYSINTKNLAEFG